MTDGYSRRKKPLITIVTQCIEYFDRVKETHHPGNLKRVISHLAGSNFFPVAKNGIKQVVKEVTEAAGKQAVKEVTEAAGKQATKEVAESATKWVPGVPIAFGAVFGCYRFGCGVYLFWRGERVRGTKEFVKGFLEVVSGLAACNPVTGTVVSICLDFTIGLWDALDTSIADT